MEVKRSGVPASWYYRYTCEPETWSRTWWSAPGWPRCWPQQTGRAWCSWSNGCGCSGNGADWLSRLGTGNALQKTCEEGVNLQAWSKIVDVQSISFLNTSMNQSSLITKWPLKAHAHHMFLPSVSRSTARFWKMSMCAEWVIVLMDGVLPLLWMWAMACVPTYSTRALISWML